MSLFDRLVETFYSRHHKEEESTQEDAQDAPVSSQPTGSNNASSSSAAAATSELAIAFESGDMDRAAKIAREQLKTKDAKKAAFQLAFNQENVLMMDMIVKTGFNPSPSMKNNQGKRLDDWMQEKALGGDDKTLQMLTSIGKMMDGPQQGLGLPTNALAQVASIRADAGQWMYGAGVSGGNALSLPSMGRSQSAGLFGTV